MCCKPRHYRHFAGTTCELLRIAPKAATAGTAAALDRSPIETRILRLRAVGRCACAIWIARTTGRRSCSVPASFDTPAAIVPPARLRPPLPLEIERKFLVTGNSWRRGDPPATRFCQGYLAQGFFTERRATVRVR